jgi:hypothetical protein
LLFARGALDHDLLGRLHHEGVDPCTARMIPDAVVDPASVLWGLRRIDRLLARLRDE